MADSFLKPIENVLDEGLVYVDEQLDNIKLRTVKVLAEGTTAITGLLLVFSILSVLLLSLAFAFVLLLGEMLDSYAKAAFIVAGALLVILIIVMLVHKRLFKNTFVDMYNNIMNPKQKEPTLEARWIKPLKAPASPSRLRETGSRPGYPCCRSITSPGTC